MPAKERLLLLQINEQIKKLNQPPAPTFSPQTGESQPPFQYSPVTLPPVILPPIKPQR